MKFVVEYPMPASGADPALLGGAGVRQVAQVLEASGFDAVCFTDHPAPSTGWLNAGGHQTFDPSAALAYCAGVTRRLKVMTYCLVVPYRNPLVTAKSLATLDLVSEGRLIVVAGTGYLSSEFAILGVDIDARNDVFDESVSVMRSAWSRHSFDYEVAGGAVEQVTSAPAPHTQGGPPIWVAGNSARSRERAARQAGWSPILMSDDIARLTKTSPLSLDGLRRHAAAMRDRAAREGRRRPTVQVQTSMSRYLHGPPSVEEHREHLCDLAEAGVDSFIIMPPGRSREELVDLLEGYADDFVGAAADL
jgi:probable F420-dependent oxidoreductase